MNYKKEYILEAKRLGHSDVEIGRNISISERAVRKQLIPFQWNISKSKILDISIVGHTAVNNKRISKG